MQSGWNEKQIKKELLDLRLLNRCMVHLKPSGWEPCTQQVGCVYLETCSFVSKLHGVFNAFQSKVKLKFQSVSVHLHVAVSFSSCVASAGRQGSWESSWFPLRVTRQLCPHFEITFTISQAQYDTVAATLFLNCLLNHEAIDCFPDTFQGQRCRCFSKLAMTHNCVCLV